MILHGNCREVMATLEADNIDSIVTDPPYGLSFMGKGWDHGVPGVEFWVEALRIAKPGAHLLAFGGSRTYHRLACAIEDAGWEVRDCIMYVYGSGFPKSHDVSKAIDREAGAEREVVGPATEGGKGQGNAYGDITRPPITAPATEAAKQWAGWGTALKPSYEPIIVARKPLVGTVAQNVLQYGTGGINIDSCRVSIDPVADASQLRTMNRNKKAETNGWGMNQNGSDTPQVISPSGRWPANFIHDGSDEVIGLFPESGKGNNNGVYCYAGKEYNNKKTSMFNGDKPQAPSNLNDSGSAARFFYTAKASKADRDEGCEGLEIKQQAVSDTKAQRYIDDVNCADGKYQASKAPSRNHHPTVKPTDLMRYLCRLVTPPGGTVLDPFCGSGSTGKGAILEGFNFIGIEREAEYVEIAKARIEWAQKQPKQTKLF